MKDLLRLLKKQKGLVCQDLVEIPLFAFDYENHFQKWLVEGRCARFLRMKILFHLKPEKMFHVGYNKYRLYHETKKTKEKGAMLLDRQYSAKDLFDYELYDMGFGQIITKIMKFSEHQSVDNDGPTQIPQNWSLGKEEVAFVAQDLIITESTVCVPKNQVEEVKERIKHIQHKLSLFVEKYKLDTVPHEIYVNWLLTWFPGRIQTRTLQ